MLDVLKVEAPTLVDLRTLVLYNPEQKSALFFVPGLAYGVGAHDLFPEEFATFMFHDAEARLMFREEHPDLLTPDFWNVQQERIRRAHVAEFFSYPQRIRFGQ